MGKRKIICILCFLTVFLIISLVLIPLSPKFKCQTLYAGSYAGHSDSRLSDEEIAIIVLINNQRAENGAKNLWYSEILGEIATFRAQDMFNKNYFSHYTPEGLNVFSLMDSRGIKVKYGGENLAKGSPIEYVTPERVVNAWLQSRVHKFNLLRKVYRQIGVGIETKGEEKIVVVVFTN